MKHLKIFVWNDEEATAQKWQKVIARGDSDDDFKRVPISCAKVPSEVVQAIDCEMPDLVVLDIKCSGDTKMGLKIAAGIREKDLLVPIVAVSREPRVVYLATDQFEHLGFAGVFDASVMVSGVFDAIVLRPSLNQWHMVAPEFPLVRACLKQLRASFGERDSQFVGELSALLTSLPFSGSLESWHVQIREPLVRLMQRRELGKLTTQFEALMRLFEQADPFYMAGSRSRRHLSHNVQVFLIGLVTLLSLPEVRSVVVRQVQQQRSGLTDSEALMDAILIWACIANTHDTAYLSEHFSELTGRLEELSRSFLKVFENTEQVKPLTKVNWPTQSHGEVTARLWRHDLPKDERIWTFPDRYCDTVAAAIARHDSKHFKNSPVDLKCWAQFLAVLADELQDWGRERLSNPPGPKPFETITWGMFCLEGIQLDQARSCIALTFIARDHPEVIAKRFGSDGEETVRGAFARIAQKLRENLRATCPFEIQLTVHFVSRPSAMPAYESICIQSLS